MTTVERGGDGDATRVEEEERENGTGEIRNREAEERLCCCAYGEGWPSSRSVPSVLRGFAVGDAENSAPSTIAITITVVIVCDGFNG